MLGSTADSLFWMFRYLERTENIVYLIETGFQLNLISSNNFNEWNSILKTTGAENIIDNKRSSNLKIINYLLRDKKNPNNILSLIGKVRANARKSRVSITREVWESINSFWHFLTENLNKNILEKDLVNIIKKIKQRIALVFGCINKTMLRNEILNFCFLGSFIERFDNTVRILSSKYYRYNIEANSKINSDFQLELILRSISAYRSFMWKSQNMIDEKSISNFLIFDKSMPRSLIFSLDEIIYNLKSISSKSSRSLRNAKIIKKELFLIKILNDESFHENLNKLINLNIQLGKSIEDEFNFH